MTTPRFLSALILMSDRPERLAAFYRGGLGIPLGESTHSGDEGTHFECELGDVHFAIHPRAVGASAAANSSIKFALAVASLDQALDALAASGVRPEYPPVDRGFARMTAIRDPDGNLVELTELSESWLRYLGGRPARERDLIASLVEPDGE